MNTKTLFEALESADGTQRRHAALALGAVRETGIAPRLIERLRAEGDSCVREDITWAIVQHAGDAEGDLLGMLGSDDADDRRTAAHVLSKVGNPEHFEQVRPLVADEDADVAIKAYRAAANTGGAAAAEALSERLGDGDHLQRDALSNAFQRIGEAGLPALIAALGNADARIREHAAETIGHVGGPEADSAAEALEALAGDGDAEVRLAAVSALGQLAFAADEPLARIAQGDDPMLAAIARRFVTDRGQAAKEAN